ncbi:MAG: 50S ribosomal protein L9 [Bacillales bacterium]|nr:50S ribosomal protein L9 [Bacillales bacterium]
MKKRIIGGIIVSSILLLAYSAIFWFAFDPSMRTLSYSIPIIVFGLALIVLLGYLGLFDSYSKENAKLKNEVEVEKQFNKDICESNETVAKELPVVILIYSDENIITYANEYAKTVFQNNLLGKRISFISSLLDELITLKKSEFYIDVYGKHLKCLSNTTSRTIYMFDYTTECSLIQKYEGSIPSIAVLSLDNLETALSGVDLQKKTEILGKYYLAIDKWREKYSIFLLATSNDRQMFIIKKPTLEKVEEDQFSILKDIDDISHNQGLEISLSIGVGVGSEDYNTLGYYSEQALAFASDRGGDQAVVYDGESHKAYGGKTQLSEKKTKTTARINSSKLIGMIKNSSSVIIMPHIDSDADSLGAALGVVEIAETLETPAKVLLDFKHIDSTVNKIIENSSFEYIKLRQSIIEEDELKNFFVGKTLLIIVDHHETALSPAKDIYKMASEIVIIDHHRLTDKLEVNAALQYIDHNSSSTVELVTELIDLAPINIKVPAYIATIMLTGMLIDTHNFVSHTSERTFAAAADLMNFGADPYKAKMYLREPVSEQVSRAKLIEKAEILLGKFAIIIDDSKTVSREHLAKAAEALVDIENIVAGFAMGNLDKQTIGVSARSNGSFNIHTLMEAIGGGGHFNVGAAQVKGKTIEEVYDYLVSKLDDTLKGDGGTMKLILIEDVKKQGKKGDIVDVTPGYGNFLLSKKFAVEANASNIAVLDEQKASLEKHLQEEFEVATKLKSLVDKLTVKVMVKVGEGGKIFGSVSTKQVADEMKKEYGIAVDKRKLVLPDEKITSLGTYKVIAKLHKDVTASFKIEIVEEKEE